MERGGADIGRPDHLTPGAPTLDPVTGLSVAPLAITASTGPTSSLTEFLYSLETLPRATKVLNVAMARDTGGEAPPRRPRRPASCR